MARTSFKNILSLPDAAQTWNFDLLFPTIPGGGNSQAMTFKCKTTALPASKIEPVPIELHGVKKQEAGRAQYDHTFQCTMMETIDYQTYMDLRGWRQFMRDWKGNTGTNSQAYKVDLELDVYDNAGNVSQTLKLCGAFLTDIADVAFSGAESQAVELQITFSFDYIDDGRSF